MNELVLLYGIVDFYARHLASSEVITVENGNVKILVDRDKLSKADRKIFDDFFKALHKLSWLPDETYNLIKQKWMKVLEGVKDFKAIKDGYYAVVVGLVLMEAYAKLKKKSLDIHPKRVEKIMELIKNEAKTDNGEFKYLEPLTIASIEWAKVILKQLGVVDGSESA